MSQQIDPNFKEGWLTLLIVMPFIILLGIEHLDKGAVWVAFGVDLFAYAVARIVVRTKTGRWKW